ncbi:MAG: hypothetical protein JSR99_17060 [Proteobacteria bacterium]|nr:hypothetical protein [Pseudomonadota bacterium]
MKNIERFDAYALHVFGVLYEAFPVPRRLDNVEIMKAVNLPRRESEAAETAIVQGTIDWLRETGFLQFRDESDTKDKMQYRYVLAPRAFEALRRDLPETMKPKGEKPKSLGEEAISLSKKLAKNASKEAVQTAVSQLVTLGISWAFGG